MGIPWETDTCLTSRRTWTTPLTTIYPLISLLQHNNDLLILQSAWSLSLLLTEDENASQFHQLGGMPILLKLLNTANRGIQLRILICLSGMVTHRKPPAIC